MMMMTMMMMMTLWQNVFVVRTITQDAFGGLISPRDFIDLVINEKTGDYLATNGQLHTHVSSNYINCYVWL